MRNEPPKWATQHAHTEGQIGLGGWVGMGWVVLLRVLCNMQLAAPKPRAHNEDATTPARKLRFYTDYLLGKGVYSLAVNGRRQMELAK